jgi:hypothetical protein
MNAGARGVAGLASRVRYMVSNKPDVNRSTAATLEGAALIFNF